MRRALVTGGGTGIGLGITEVLLSKGFEVVITGRRAEVLEAAAARTGAAAVVGDVCGDVGALLDRVGSVELLVSNAGHHAPAPLGAWTADDWAGLYRVHTIAPALLAQEWAARHEGAGCIVHIASTLAVRAAPFSAAYASAKAGMVALTRSLALELAPRGIRANALLPGVVPTAMTDGRADALVGLHPLGRLGRPSDVGEAVAWLADATWVTGAAIPVDGGLLVRE